uniref:Large ribosomal subunit protein uL23 n=1 Tax=candidate division WWE3 bacterium TaxID=2053526 RepID=A0A831YZN1_UNCKA
MNVYQILKIPVISEKGLAQARQGKYLFRVAVGATKKEIAKAVEAVYKGVKVAGVNVLRTPAEVVRWRTPKKRPVKARRSGEKKALVTLAEGKIEIFEEK